MYETKINEMVRDFEMRLSQQGLNLEMYLTYTNMDMAAFRKTFEDQAQKQVKVRLALEKIAELENINVTDEDIENEYKEMAETYKMELDKVKSVVSAEALAEDLKVEKAFDLVRESAEVTEAAE
jgi:trigger factor